MKVSVVLRYARHHWVQRYKRLYKQGDASELDLSTVKVLQYVYRELHVGERG
jgi:hypothetical protein